MWWKAALAGPLEMSLVMRPVEAAIATDASDIGLGAVLDVALPHTGELFVDGESGERGAQVKENLLARDPERHINEKELEALLRVLVRHGERLRRQKVVWYTDSTTARAAVARQGTQCLSKGTWEMAKAVLDRSREQGIELVPTHVPGRLNGAADGLSRPGQERS